MTTILKPLILSALLALGTDSFAEQAHHPAPTGGAQHEMGGMNNPEHLKEMQAHNLMMHDLSNKILAETDPQKQQALKDQQLELIKTHHMQMMAMHHGKGMDHDMGNMDPAKMAERLKQKQAHMLSMHELTNKILAETDPQKQQALKDQQLELMKAHHQQMMSKHHK